MYIIEANNNIESKIYTVHNAPGNKTYKSPYRLELGCILIMPRCYITNQGSIELVLDGKQVMEQASDTFLLFPAQCSFDILVNIRANISLLPITIKLFWVEGHQLQRYGHQPYLGEINNKFDNLAYTYWL